MLEMHKEIRKMRQEKEKYKHIYTEGEDLIKVRNSLNNRAITLKEMLLEQPDKQSLNLELEFCLSEAERLEEEYEKFQEKYGSTESQIDMHEHIIDYDLRQLDVYVDYLKKLAVDRELVDAIDSCVKSLDENITKLNYLKKQ